MLDFLIDFRMLYFSLWGNTTFPNHALIWPQPQNEGSLLQLGRGHPVPILMPCSACWRQAFFLCGERRKRTCYSDYLAWIGSLFWRFTHQVVHDGLHRPFAARRGWPAPGRVLVSFLLLVQCSCDCLVSQLHWGNPQKAFLCRGRVLLGYWAEQAPPGVRAGLGALRSTAWDCGAGGDGSRGKRREHLAFVLLALFRVTQLCGAMSTGAGLPWPRSLPACREGEALGLQLEGTWDKQGVVMPCKETRRVWGEAVRDAFWCRPSVRRELTNYETCCSMFRGLKWINKSLSGHQGFDLAPEAIELAFWLLWYVSLKFFLWKLGAH